MFWDDDLRAELLERRAAGLERRPPLLESAIGPRSRVNGRDVLVFGSNDYLGLANHPSVVEASIRAAKRYGTGAAASRLLVGNASLNVELESEIARFTGHERAIVFASGYAANAGAITALTGNQDLILSDALNHASLIDACRLSRAETRVYQHGDPDFVWFALRKDRESFRRVLIVTDGVFSMDGDVAPLPELCRLAEEHRAAIIVDDAHALGVLGDRGRGTLEHHGLIGHPAAIQVGTLSKALGSVGGCVAASEPVVATLRQTARTYGYSTGLPPAALASAWQALRIVQRDPGLVHRLRANTAYLRDGLHRVGFRVGEVESPIIPVIVGSARDTMRFADACFRQGLYAPAIRPPSVPEGSSRIRLSVSAAHTREHMVEAIGILTDVARAVPLMWSA